MKKKDLLVAGIFATLTLGIGNITQQMSIQSAMAGTSQLSQQLATIAPAAGSPANSQAKEQGIDVEKAMEYRSFGSDTAPIIIENFSAMTCPHCGRLHRAMFEKLKTEYIDTGIVRYVVTPFPFNESSLHAAMLTQCVAEDKFERLLSLLYENQTRWAFDANPKEALFNIVRFTGITKPFFDACINNKDIEDFVTESLRHGSEDYGITGTPTLVFNHGEAIERGASTYEQIKRKIDLLYNKHQKQQ